MKTVGGVGGGGHRRGGRRKSVDKGVAEKFLRIDVAKGKGSEAGCKEKKANKEEKSGWGKRHKERRKI